MTNTDTRVTREHHSVTTVITLTLVLVLAITCAVDAGGSDPGVVDAGPHHAVQNPFLLGSEMWRVTK